MPVAGRSKPRKFGVDATYAEGAPAALPRSQQPFLCYDRSTALDLVVAGKKLVGSAKRRVDGRALQHGSIILQRHSAVPGTAAVADHVEASFDVEMFGRNFAAGLAVAADAGVVDDGACPDQAAGGTVDGPNRAAVECPEHRERLLDAVAGDVRHDATGGGRDA